MREVKGRSCELYSRVAIAELDGFLFVRTQEYLIVQRPVGVPVVTEVDPMNIRLKTWNRTSDDEETSPSTYRSVLSHGILRTVFC